MDWEMFPEEVSALRVSPSRRAWWPWIICRDAARMLVCGAGGGAGVRRWSRLCFLRLLCTRFRLSI